MPNAGSEHPYDSTETFSRDELHAAFELRQRIAPDRDTILKTKRRDHCPHTPRCPNGRVCVEEIAWYLRHRVRLQAEDV